MKKNKVKIIIGIIAGVLILSFVINGIILNSKSTINSVNLEEYQSLFKEDSEKLVLIKNDSCTKCKEIEKSLEEVKKQSEEEITTYVIDVSITPDEELEKLLKDNETDSLLQYITGSGVASSIKKNISTDSIKKMIGVLIEISYEDYMEIANSNEESYVFVGSPSCPYCMASQPIIKRVFSEESKPIYYLNLSKVSQNSVSDLVEKTEGVFKGSVPHLLVFKSGKLQRELLGKRSYAEYKALIK